MLPTVRDISLMVACVHQKYFGESEPLEVLKKVVNLFTTPERSQELP